MSGVHVADLAGGIEEKLDVAKAASDGKRLGEFLMANWRIIEESLMDFCRREAVATYQDGDIHTEDGINLTALAKHLEDEQKRWPSK